MSIRAIALLLLWLGPMCFCDRIRILSKPNSQSELVSQGAFKSRIRSLTLKSNLEREVFEPAASQSHRSKSSKRGNRIPPASSFIESDDDASDFGDFGASTADPYREGPTTLTTTVSPLSSTPCTIVLPSCFCFKSCNDCGCGGHTTVIPTITPVPYVQPPTITPVPYVQPPTGTPAPYPQPPTAQPTPCSSTPGQTPCSPSTPAPYPQPTQPTPCSQTTPSSQPGSGCIIPILIPCYVCPCLSQCSLVPYQDCPCGVDPGEYQCPYPQPYAATINELPEKFEAGYRVADTLRPAPSCAYNQGPYHPSQGNPNNPTSYNAGQYNPNPGSYNPNPGSYQPNNPVNPTNPANPTNPSSHLNPANIQFQPSNKWPQQQFQLPALDFGGNHQSQVHFPLAALNLKAESPQHQAQPDQASHFVPLGAHATEDLSQAQPSNYYLYRQQRQRALPNQEAYKNQQAGQQSYYPQPPQPAQPYAQPPQPQPYPVQPQPYPQAPTEVYAIPSTTGSSTTSTTTVYSSASGHLIPISVLMASLGALMVTMGLIN